MAGMEEGSEREGFIMRRQPALYQVCIDRSTTSRTGGDREGGGEREGQGERGPFEGRWDIGGRGSDHYNWRVRCDPDHINGHFDPAPDVQRVSTTSHLFFFR